MKLKLEQIISVVNELADLAHCDLDCFCGDFDANDYIKYADKIKTLAKEIESEIKK